MCNFKTVNYQSIDILKKSCTLIDVRLCFIDFCKAIDVIPGKMIGRPYNREASKCKTLFVAIFFLIHNEKSQRTGYKKDLSRVLFMPYQNIDGLLYKANLYLKIYPDFKSEVDEILIKIIVLTY